MYYKKFGILLPVLALLLGASSCSEKFKVDAPYRNITVVYGLMNISDTAHYVRIEKAFLDEDKSALDLAKIADSSYYKSLDVKMREVQNGRAINTFALTQVDLAADGYPKDTGVFFNTPHMAWKFTAPLNPSFTYRLVITNKTSGEVDSAETNIIDNTVSTTSFYVADWVYSPYTLQFLPNQPVNRDKFSFTVRPPAGAALLEGIIRFHYKDSNTVSSAVVPDSLDWNFSTVGTSGNVVTLSASYTAFYSFLGGNIPLPATNVVRVLGAADLFVWAANSDFYNYTEVAGATGGLTSDQIKPVFTNIKGSPNTIGLFADRAFIAKYNVPITEATLDSLEINAQTAPLHFRHHP